MYIKGAMDICFSIEGKIDKWGRNLRFRGPRRRRRRDIVAAKSLGSTCLLFREVLGRRGEEGAGEAVIGAVIERAEGGLGRKGIERLLVVGCSSSISYL